MKLRRPKFYEVCYIIVIIVSAVSVLLSVHTMGYNQGFREAFLPRQERLWNSLTSTDAEQQNEQDPSILE